jgi:hypothetical protein
MPRPTPKAILSEVLYPGPFSSSPPVVEAPTVTVDWIVTLVFGVTVLVEVGEDGALDRSRPAGTKEISCQAGLRTSVPTTNTSAAVSIGRDPLAGELEPSLPVTVVIATTVVVGEEESSVVSATLLLGTLREQ